jgi:uncharacterized protein YecE (DUF72 family)
MAFQPSRTGKMGQADEVVEEHGCDVLVYFDNDQISAAPADALKLIRLLA